MPSLHNETELLQQEEESNDPSIIWPSIRILQQLPADWLPEQQGGDGRKVHTDEQVNGISSAPSKREEDTNKRHKNSADQVYRKKRSKNLQDRPVLRDNLAHTSPCPRPSPPPQQQQQQQPYYLNHVRGSTRLRQASQRLAAASGTLIATYLLCNPSFSSSSSSPFIKFEDVGLKVTSVHRVLSDIVHGIVIGSTIVVILFGVEVYMGWIRIVGFWEKVVSDEKFVLNLLWDALFHMGVSVNEELM